MHGFPAETLFDSSSGSILMKFRIVLVGCGTLGQGKPLSAVDPKTAKLDGLDGIELIAATGSIILQDLLAIHRDLHL